VIRRAIEDAGIDFRRVGYIECHGTGTELGGSSGSVSLRFDLNGLYAGSGLYANRVINAGALTDRVLIAQTVIHLAFLLSALIMAWVDRLTTHTHPQHFHNESIAPKRALD
jgi:hypothetical protein